MITDPIRMCELLVGLPAVAVLGVVDLMPATPLSVHIETVIEGRQVCASCGTTATIKDRDKGGAG